MALNLAPIFKAYREGAPVELGAGARVFVRATGMQYLVALQNYDEQERLALGLTAEDSLPAAASVRVTVNALVDETVLGWENVELEEGQPLADKTEAGELHKENARILLSCEPVLGRVQVALNKLGLSIAKQLEVAQGNSEGP